ncbi:MAG: hypothetical protein AB7H80_04275, partial [Candidatus Kapaibacterium sp.]
GEAIIEAPTGIFDGFRAYIATYTTSGDFVSAQHFGLVDRFSLPQVVIDSENNRIITGRIWPSPSTIDLDPGPGELNIPITKNQAGIYTLSVTKDGTSRYGFTIGPSSSNDPAAIGVDSRGNVFQLFSFPGEIDVDPSEGKKLLTSNGMNDIGVSLYDPNGRMITGVSSLATEEFTSSRLTINSLSPSPVVDQVQAEIIPGVSGKTTLSIADLQGNVVREVLLGWMESGIVQSVTVDVTDLPSGSYTLILTEESTGKRVSRPLLVLH